MAEIGTEGGRLGRAEGARLTRIVRAPRRAAQPRSAGVLAAAALLALLPGAAPGQAGGDAPARDRCGRQVVSEAELEAVIRGQEGYDITAAPNEGRFMARMILELASRHRSRRPDGPPFVIRQREFWPAFLRMTGLRPDQAPPAFRRAREFGQRIAVEYRRDRVLEAVREGPEPRRAVSVRVSWPDTGGAPSSYTYEDTASTPRVRIRHRQNITYRLLEYVAVVAYDEIDGVAGRPTSGALGALFDVIGMAEIEETRFVVAGNGTQVTYARGSKVVPFETVAHVTADGRAKQGLPGDEPRFERLREIVTRELEVSYAGDPPPACPAPG